MTDLKVFDVEIGEELYRGTRERPYGIVVQRTPDKVEFLKKNYPNIKYPHLGFKSYKYEDSFTISTTVTLENIIKGLYK